MKTSKLPPPPVEEEDYVLPSRDEHLLRVRFICAALSGLCSGEDGHNAAPSYIVSRAFEIGEEAVERYVEENNDLLFKLATVKAFNQKVGLGK